MTETNIVGLAEDIRLSWGWPWRCVEGAV